MNKSEFFKTAHHVARMTVSKVGDYKIALVIAMNSLYAEANKNLGFEGVAKKLNAKITETFGCFRVIKDGKEAASITISCGNFEVRKGGYSLVASARSFYDAVNFVLNGVVTTNMLVR